MASALPSVSSVEEKKLTLKIVSEIKGYHVFHVRPTSEIPLLIIPEDGNKFDPNAMLVKVPDMVPPSMHSIITRPALKKGSKDQTVKDILGKTVGRVPANLCQTFRSILGRQPDCSITWWVLSLTMTYL